MRRVLMISPHFPPDTSAGAHRVRLLAPHLSAFGWEPTVVTVREDGYEGRLDPELASLVPASLRVLRAPAWSVGVTRLLGVGDLGLRALCGLKQTCAALLRRERFDALFITIYPTYPALLGPWLKRRYHLPFVLDYQDPWVGAWGLEVGGGPNGRPDLKSRVSRLLAAQLEPRVVRAADGLTAVSARTYEDVLARVTGAHPRACAAIPLGFEERDLEALRRRPRATPYFDAGDGLIHVCYVGTILPAGLDVLRAVMAGLARLNARAHPLFGRLRLHFLGTSNQRQPNQAHRVLPLARTFGVADIVTEEPTRLDYLDALNVQVQASALLLMGSSEAHYTPSKVFPALLSGRPIVALYHAASNVVPLLSQHRGATTITFERPGDLEAVERQVADAFERLAQGITERAEERHGDARLEPWSAATLAGRLAGVLDAVA